MIRLLSLILAVVSACLAFCIARKRRMVDTDIWLVAAVVILCLTMYDSLPTVKQGIEVLTRGIPEEWTQSYRHRVMVYGAPAFFPFPVYPNGGLWMHRTWYYVSLLVLNALDLILLLLYRYRRVGAAQ